MHEYLLLSHSRQGISSAHQLWTYLHFLTSVVVVWLRLQPASTMKAYDYTEVVLEHRSSGKYIIFFFHGYMLLSLRFSFNCIFFERDYRQKPLHLLLKERDRSEATWRPPPELRGE